MKTNKVGQKVSYKSGSSYYSKQSCYKRHNPTNNMYTDTKGRERGKPLKPSRRRENKISKSVN